MTAIKVVLVDLNMPGMDGLEAAAVRAGADAFLPKTDLGTKLYALLDRMFPGQAHG